MRRLFWLIPLILLPGLLCDATLWRHQRENLADLADITVADLTGHGSFAALADVHTPDAHNNIVASTASALLDVTNSILVTEQEGHMIAAIGVQDLIIVHSPDATLVCHKDHADKLKGLLEQIEQQGDGSYL